MRCKTQLQTGFLPSAARFAPRTKLGKRHERKATMSAVDNQDESMEGNVAYLIMYTHGQMAKGKTNDEIISDLVAKGVTHELDQTIVEQTWGHYGASMRKQEEQIEGMVTEHRVKRYVAAQRGWKRMWIGLLGLLIGSFITWGSYSTAESSPYGGSYTICYGAIILGAIYFLWGLAEWSSNR